MAVRRLAFNDRRAYIAASGRGVAQPGSASHWGVGVAGSNPVAPTIEPQENSAGAVFQFDRVRNGLR